MLYLIISLLCVTAALSTDHEEARLLLSRRIDGVDRKVINLRKYVSSLDHLLHEHMNVSASIEVKKSLPELLTGPVNSADGVEQLVMRVMRREEQMKTQQQRMFREIKQFMDEISLCRTWRQNGKVPETEKHPELVERLRNGVHEEFDQLRNDIQQEFDTLRHGLQEEIHQLSRRLYFAANCKKMWLNNPSFEVDGGWRAYRGGYQIVSEEAQDGTKSAEVTSGGVTKVLTFAEPIRRLIVSGWSKNKGSPSSIPSRSDYSLYCDLQTRSKRNLYGYVTPFRLQNSTWHQVTVQINLSPTDAFVKATCHFLYRNINQGVAYFDKMSASVVTDEVTDLSVCTQE